MTPPEYHRSTHAPSYSRQKTNGKAIASFVLGLLGVTIFPFIPPIFAVVLGTIARREIRNGPHQSGDGLALAGLVLGWIGIAMIALTFLMALFVFGLVNSLGSDVG